MSNKNINIYLEANPNPNSLKFVADHMLVEAGQNYDFPTSDSAGHAPLAKELFEYDFVRRVFYMSNFVTITKSAEVEWPDIQDELKKHIEDFLASGRPILEKQASESVAEDTEMDKKIRVLLDEYVKPSVEQDGGAIEYKSFEDGVVKVFLQGSCSGCPSASITLKAGIENLLKSQIPEVKAVEAEEV
jgi:Fe-S cluster biogenesis protein NfuA